MRNVMIVVVVLIRSCQLSLNRKTGPVSAQTRIRAMAANSANGDPSDRVMRSEASRNRSASLTPASPLRGAPFEVRPLELFALELFAFELLGFELSPLRPCRLRRF